MGKGLLIIAHGSRVEETKDVVTMVVEKIKSPKNTKDVKAGFMEFNEPDISTSIREFVEEGIYDIIAVPMFLFEGNHVLHDIPEVFGKEKEKYPGLKIKFAKSIGYDDRIVGPQAKEKEVLLMRLQSLI
ncbi:sirohydrochlorin chelatase [Thermoanaerobacter thermocopriae]|uniref:sirohydrochlorin chelatase n=1 Tax=Thermoanaerobacter thermocopriae TaxID=29350 RepID=UPI00048C3CB8|nr:CbiX/SirB N-terminal domain-containing protein [Thermoanaerobacter thermocopriae]